MKKCWRCKTFKGYENFRKAKTKDWYFSYCIDCNKEHQKEWKENNKEKMKLYMAEYHKWYYQENKEKIDEKNKKWADNNRVKVKIHMDKYRWKPWIMDMRNKKRSEWWKMNPEKNIEKCRKRKSIIKNTCDGTVTKESLNSLIVNQWYKCNICSCDISKNPEKDHIIPLSKWWQHTISNIQYLCWLCNRKKWTSIL